MTQKELSLGSARRVAKQLVDLSDPKRKEALKTFPSTMRCRIVEEMVNIRLKRIRSDDGTFKMPESLQ